MLAEKIAPKQSLNTITIIILIYIFLTINKNKVIENIKTLKLNKAPGFVIAVNKILEKGQNWHY